MQKRRQTNNTEELKALADSLSSTLGIDYNDPDTAAVCFVSFIQILIDIDKSIESDEDEQKEPHKNS